MNESGEERDVRNIQLGTKIFITATDKLKCFELLSFVTQPFVDKLFRLPANLLVPLETKYILALITGQMTAREREEILKDEVKKLKEEIDDLHLELKEANTVLDDF
jgi:hypothetical protein